MIRKRRSVSRPFEKGQVWEVADSSVLIAEVGKTLVHYKRFKNMTKGMPTLLTSKRDLEKYLNENQAILVQQ
jgi:hypothetical protein